MSQKSNNPPNVPKVPKKKANRRTKQIKIQPVPKPQKNDFAAAAYSRMSESTKPIIEASHDFKRVRHRELLGSVTGSVVYTNALSVALNPGLVSSFPWLSMESLGWETYRFNSLRFEYFTRTGTATPGSVILAVDYDASDPAPLTEQIAANYAGSREDAPWKDICLDLMPSALHGIGPRKFLRYGATAANEDIKTYDSGNFYLATIDGTAIPWGKLWVSYDVTFYTPQMPGTTLLTSALQIESATAPTTAAVFGATVTPKQGGPVDVSVSGNVITFLVPGQYVVDYDATATTSITFVSATPSVGMALNYSTSLGSGGTAFIYDTIWTVTQPGATLTYAITFVAGLTAHLLVAALPASPIF